MASDGLFTGRDISSRNDLFDEIDLSLENSALSLLP